MAEKRNRSGRVETVRRICRDPQPRRELLWLHALGKGDEEHARVLLACDPEIPARLAGSLDLEVEGDVTDRARREHFMRLYDAHYAALDERLGPERPRGKETIALTIDPREPDELVRLAEERGAFAVRRERLSVGDFLVAGTILAERKTIADLCKSIVNARVFRQARELVASPYRPVIILEGSSARRRSRLGREQIQGALITLTMVFGIPLLRSRSPSETVWLLERLHAQSRRRLGRGFAARQWNPRDQDALRVHLLARIPSIGVERATRLLEAFGSVRAVLNASEEELCAVRGMGRTSARALRELVDATAA